jgi:hypothetical protein
MLSNTNNYRDPYSTDEDSKNGSSYDLVRYIWQSINGLIACRMTSKDFYDYPKEKQVLTHPIIGLFEPAS